MLDSWRENWNKEFQREQMTTNFAFLILKRFRNDQERTHEKRIAKMINIAIEDQINIYFKNN